MSTIVWNVSAMNCYPQAEGETDVVFTVHWQCNGVDGDYSSSVYSTCSFPVVEGTSFTAYADLTQDQVLGWVWANGVDKDATEAAVEGQIETQINPPIVAPPLPWSV